jgi:hypothetical protein
VEGATTVQVFIGTDPVKDAIVDAENFRIAEPGCHVDQTATQTMAKGTEAKIRVQNDLQGSVPFRQNILALEPPKERLATNTKTCRRVHHRHAVDVCEDRTAKAQQSGRSII